MSRGSRCITNEDMESSNFDENIRSTLSLDLWYFIHKEIFSLSHYGPEKIILQVHFRLMYLYL